MDRTIPLRLPLKESFDIGADTLTGVSADYQMPFDFAGKIDGLTLKIDRPKFTPEDEAKLRKASSSGQRQPEGGP